MIEAYFSQIEAIEKSGEPNLFDVLLEIAQRERTHKSDKFPKY